MRRRSVWAALTAVATPTCLLTAQAARPDSARQPPVSQQGRLAVTGCAGQRINDIVVITQPPYTERLPKRFEFLRRAARTLHSTTRDDIIRRYLLMKPGDACNQIQRAESERILRAQPFLVDARIRVYDDEAGGVRLEVETRDEFSTTVSPIISAKAPVLRALRFAESNLAGSARLVGLQWRDGGAYNDVIGAQFTDYQFLGQRNELRMLGVRRERGQQLRIDVVHPYYTDLQRYAFLGSVDGTRDYASLLRPTSMGPAINTTRQSAVLGAIARVGTVGRLKLAGFSVAQSRDRYDTARVMITDKGFRPDTGSPFGATFKQRNVLRVNALFGVRLLRFVPVEGFDALTGAQDVRVGMQLSMVFGQTIGVGSARDHDRFIATGVYGGVGGEQSFLGAQLAGEARNDRGTRTWDNQIYSGRVAWYFRPAVHQLTFMSVEWSAGRNMQSPFQLSLADFNGGIRGHRGSWTPGGERLVARVEQRLVIPSRLNVADIGVAWFAEAGRLWADPSVPYSTSTSTRGAVGMSLLAAVPPRSRRLWRLDVAVPVGGDPRKKFEVRISNEDRTRTFWREPDDVLRARERTVPTSLFTWP